MTNGLGLAGKRVVITGAGRGLGRALAIVAADRGAEVVLLGRSSAALDSVAAAIKSRNGTAPLAVACDLARPDSVHAACETVLAGNPVIDVLVNNGCPWLPGELAGLPPAEIVETVAAGVTGTILATQALLPGLRRSRAADIVAVVSTAGWPGWDFGVSSAPFHAAKHGQSGFSDALRHELKPEGIRVTAIYPPNFDDVDPLMPAWNDANGSAATGQLTNREVVETVLFVLAAPRACTYPVIILDNMPARSV